MGDFDGAAVKIEAGLGGSARYLLSCLYLRLTLPRAKIAATNFYDRAKVWAKNEAKFWTKFSGYFRASCAAQNDPPKCLPKVLPIHHSMSCNGSCGWSLESSSPRASGGLGRPTLQEWTPWETLAVTWWNHRGREIDIQEQQIRPTITGWAPVRMILQ